MFVHFWTECHRYTCINICVYMTAVSRTLRLYAYTSCSTHVMVGQCLVHGPGQISVPSDYIYIYIVSMSKWWYDRLSTRAAFHLHSVHVSQQWPESWGALCLTIGRLHCFDIVLKDWTLAWAQSPFEWDMSQFSGQCSGQVVQYM